MRILHALAQKPGQTGSGVFLQQLFQAGFAKGYEQAVLAGIPQMQTHSDIANLKSDNFFPVHFESKALPFCVVGMSDVMPYPSTRYSDMNEKMLKQYKIAFTCKIKEAIATFRPTVIIAHHLWFMSALIKELFPEIKVLCLCHGTDLRQIELAPNLYKIVQQNITKCDFVFALNDIQKQTIIEKYGFDAQRVIISGTGYDPSRFYLTQKPKPDPIRIIYAGKISHAKGVLHLLRAFENLAYNHDTLVLELIGGGAGNESEEILAYAKSMQTNVSYLGLIEQKELAKKFQNAHIFVLPSFYEGLPLVVIEALACGMRVVVTKLAGLEAFLGQSFEDLGLISYVDLPKMQSIDKPHIDGIEKFETDIKKALQTQIHAIKANKSIEHKMLQESLQDKTWKGLFEKLECYMQTKEYPYDEDTFTRR
ncbi:MAG: glycosyltransferase family 4 protein [Sulfurospirillum sp.]|nr:glycosyltransferase family 4 protein [Sulfurospirillum sp.]